MLQLSQEPDIASSSCANVKGRAWRERVERGNNERGLVLDPETLPMPVIVYTGNAVVSNRGIDDVVSRAGPDSRGSAKALA